MRAHEQHLVTRDGGAPKVRFARPGDEQRAAVDLLDHAEAAAGGPLVDEAERVRLDRVSHHDGSPAEHWHPLLAWPPDDEAQPTSAPTGYVGLLLPPDGNALADLVPAVDAPSGTVPALLDATRRLASQHDATRLTLWVRHATDDLVDAATDEQWSVHRRLFVLGLSLIESRTSRPLPDGITLGDQAADPATDGQIARLLRRAYAGTQDATWPDAEVRRRRALAWFRAEDLLLARRGDELVGLHWTKRRGGGTGEVYNLAVDPNARGLGLGSALLDAGIDHLEALGCSKAVLWVDAANQSGVHLYGTRGFTRRWQDVAFSAPMG